LGKQGTLELSPIPEAEVQLALEGDQIYALGFTHALARSRLYRFSRDGGPATMVAEQKGLGQNKRFVVANGAAYYVQAGRLFKLGPAQGSALTLAEGVNSQVAVVGAHALVMACDDKSHVDHLLRIPIDGGAAEPIAEVPRASRDTCQYPNLVADEREAYVADWNGSRILSVSLKDGGVRPLVRKRGFPGPLLLEPDALVFLSALGLQRTARTPSADAPTRLAGSDEALAPWSFIAATSAAYWVFDAIAYTTETTLHRIPRGGGRSKPIMTLKNRDPNAESYEGQGLSDFAIDEECVYVAQTQYKRPGMQILVRSVE